RGLDRGPESWTLLSPDHVSAAQLLGGIEDAPSWWFMPNFPCTDPDSGVFLGCTFVAWHQDEPGVAVYKAEEWHYEEWLSYPAGEVFVREVPAALVVSCTLAHIENRDFEVTYTTLAGTVMLHIPKVSNLSQNMKELTLAPTLAAAAQGRLKSRNQEVQTVLAGQSDPLGATLVPELFWGKLKARDAAER
ncbi:unnamed protein product, partial [Durusdinium trenchii]